MKTWIVVFSFLASMLVSIMADSCYLGCQVNCESKGSSCELIGGMLAVHCTNILATCVSQCNAGCDCVQNCEDSCVSANQLCSRDPANCKSDLDQCVGSCSSGCA